jgi:hypothetical protein
MGGLLKSPFPFHTDPQGNKYAGDTVDKPCDIPEDMDAQV